MPNWVDAGAKAGLEAKGRRIFKANGKQILLIANAGQLFACNNRCPHEGYPLSEGTLSATCTLTCNWHNWKFDLTSGETLVGGDRLRLYPLEVRGDRIWVDIADLPEEERQACALANLHEARDDNDYERMAREVARYTKAGGDPFEPLRQSIQQTAARFEYGMTHAFAAAPDWLALYDSAPTPEQKLVALVEPVAHIAWDTLREPNYPFTDKREPWDAAAFASAVEIENEDKALALLHGALSEGRAGLENAHHALTRAALAHYQDFGHSAIYVYKAFQLIERLGPTVAKPILQALTRSIIYASREDRIPEFRHYAKVLSDGPKPPIAATPAELASLSVNTALERTAALPGTNEEKYRLLLEASALQMLRFDTSVDAHTDKPVSHNVRWLDYTHMLTFANAIRQHCTAEPDLWPQALLQMACFIGRNAAYLEREPDEAWSVEHANKFFATEQAALYDHGIREPIFACHRVKVLTAVKEETTWAGESHLKSTLLAATNRYLHHPIKGHHALRAAHQALSFIEAEG